MYTFSIISQGLDRADLRSYCNHFFLYPHKLWLLIHRTPNPWLKLDIALLSTHIFLSLFFLLNHFALCPISTDIWYDDDINLGSPWLPSMDVSSAFPQNSFGCLQRSIIYWAPNSNRIMHRIGGRDKVHLQTHPSSLPPIKRMMSKESCRGNGAMYASHLPYKTTQISSDLARNNNISNPHGSLHKMS